MLRLSEAGRLDSYIKNNDDIHRHISDQRWLFICLGRIYIYIYADHPGNLSDVRPTRQTSGDTTRHLPVPVPISIVIIPFPDSWVASIKNVLSI